MDDEVLRVQWLLDLSLAPSLLPQKAPWPVTDSKEGALKPWVFSNCPHSDPRCLVCAISDTQIPGPVLARQPAASRPAPYG